MGGNAGDEEVRLNATIDSIDFCATDEKISAETTRDEVIARRAQSKSGRGIASDLMHLRGTHPSMRGRCILGRHQSADRSGAVIRNQGRERSLWSSRIGSGSRYLTGLGGRASVFLANQGDLGATKGSFQ